MLRTKLLLTGVVALLLATGAAHARTWHTWKCPYGIEVTLGAKRDWKETGKTAGYALIEGLNYDPEKHRLRVRDNPAAVWLNRKRCQMRSYADCSKEGLKKQKEEGD